MAYRDIHHRHTSHVRKATQLPETCCPLTFQAASTIWKLSWHFKLITSALSGSLDILQIAEMDSSRTLMNSLSLDIYLQKVWDAFWGNRLSLLTTVETSNNQRPKFYRTIKIKSSISRRYEIMYFFFLQFCMSQLTLWFLLRWEVHIICSPLLRHLSPLW